MPWLNQRIKNAKVVKAWQHLGHRHHAWPPSLLNQGVVLHKGGTLIATGHTVERYIGNPQTVQHCMNVYAWALENYAEGVRAAFKGHALTKAQFAAALSFHWNTGAIGKAAWVLECLG